MNRVMILSMTASAAALHVGVLAQESEQEPTDVEIAAFVYEPVELDADGQHAELEVPNGFTIERFADGLENPRMIAVADDGAVYVTQRDPGNLVRLLDEDGDGRADAQDVVLEIEQLHGVAIDGDSIYLVDVQNVYRGDLQPDGSVSNLETIVDDLPIGGQHPNRTIAVGPDGMLYVSIGSTCNACDETNTPAATMERMDTNGGNRTTFASGLRNTIGFDWHPLTGRLYGMDHGIDWLGNDEQREELNEIVEGARYGWPFVYEDGKLNPQDEPKDMSAEEWAEMSEAPIALHDAHAAPMQMVFYDGEQFPEEYRGDAFVAMRGSWNRKPPSGYEVVRLDFDERGEFDGFEPFATGFLVERDDGTHGFVGRPTGIAVAEDGALLVGDDVNGVIYRISYERERGAG